MNELTYYNAAKVALAHAAKIDEVKGIKDKAEAIRLYAQQQKDDDLERYANEIKVRAMRRLGELSLELDKDVGGRPEKTHPNTGKSLPILRAIQEDIIEPIINIISDTKTKTEVLRDAGISTSTAHRCEKLAKMAEEKFEEAISDGETVTEILKSLNVHVSNNSGENEWYTPANIIEAARAAMGGIDLDPASSEIANKTVKAKKFYSHAENGLAQKWYGNVWMNPPYSQPEISEFSARLCEAVANREITQACVLVNNATETRWCQNMLRLCSDVCFLSSRIKFLNPDGVASGAPLQGQILMYFGKNQGTFFDEFSGMGVILGL